ncbi:MAG: methyltransferase domain-containing protein [Thermosphaera sp.]
MNPEQYVKDLKCKYIENLKRKGAIKSKCVERAFWKVNRHQLIEEFYEEDEKGEFEYVGKRFAKRKLEEQNLNLELLKIIYSDRPILINLNPPASSSQPFLVAEMLELLELKPGLNVLEIGTGSGYNAALIQEIVGENGCVTTIEIQKDLAAKARERLKALGYDKIHVIEGDGALGYSENAPYDRIIATVGCPDISWRWVEQLAPNGFMLIPLQHGVDCHPLVRIWRDKERIVGRFVGWSGFMSILGELAMPQKGPSFVDFQRLASSMPMREFPLPPVLKNLDETGLLSFGLFSAIVDERAFFWIGLWDKEKGAILVQKNKIVLYGDESLYCDLKNLCNQWEKLGKPGISEWMLELYPLSRTPEGPRETTSWVIKRQFSVEIILLKTKEYNLNIWK